MVIGVSLLPWVLQGALGSFRKELTAGQVVSSLSPQVCVGAGEHLWLWHWVIPAQVASELGETDALSGSWNPKIHRAAPRWVWVHFGWEPHLGAHLSHLGAVVLATTENKQ